MAERSDLVAGRAEELVADATVAGASAIAITARAAGGSERNVTPKTLAPPKGRESNMSEFYWSAYPELRCPAENETCGRMPGMCTPGDGSVYWRPAWRSSRACM
jgi:hypothetical protein